MDLQNALYNGWLHCVYVTSVMCFGLDGTIVWAQHNCPGSWNESENSRKFRDLLRNKLYSLQDHGVISDSAFPVSGDMFDCIVTPLKKGDILRHVLFLLFSIINDIDFRL
ncbi:hypothetical protein HK096_000881, partial [Nowakowskiella sp. JEL0078]